MSSDPNDTPCCTFELIIQIARLITLAVRMATADLMRIKWYAIVNFGGQENVAINVSETSLDWSDGRWWYSYL